MKNLKFNEDEYLAANPDVLAAVKCGTLRSGYEHYMAYGKTEGRLLKHSENVFSREEKVFHLLDKTGLGLEIGPSHNPIAPKKNGFNVQILDHVNADQLRDKYKDHKNYGVKIENIEDVDYVWHGEVLSELIGKTSCYDWIIASHVIEHMPDIISFFQQCEVLLKPSGILSLVIPDKRFCFDYFSPISSTGNVLDAYAEKRTRPSHGQVFDHFANSVKRNGKITWSSEMQNGPNELIHTFAQAKALYAQSISSDQYIDTHCWRFTPANFGLIISDLITLDLISLDIKDEFETSGCEFFVSLGKMVGSRIEADRLSYLAK